MQGIWGFPTGSSYNSKYGASGLKKEYSTGNVATNQVQNKSDYVEIRRRKQSNFGWIPNVVVLAGTAFGVYKGKSVIQKTIPHIKELGRGTGKFIHKICPNLCDAVTSFCKFLTAPFRLVGKAGKAVGKIFKK